MSYRILIEYTASELRKAELERLMSAGLLKIAAIPYVSGTGSQPGIFAPHGK